ncbi:unnamed protein product [Caenorhabditis brenneri]
MEILCIIYGVPSLLLSLLFLKFLNRNEFKYSFYRILQCDMVLNVLCYLNGWFIRFCNWKASVPMMLVVYENFYVAFQFTTFCVNFYFNAQAMSVIFMSVHRLSSSKFLNANGFWSKFYLPLYLLILTLSLFLAAYVYLNVMLRPKTYNYTLEVFMTTPVDPVQSSKLTTIFFFESLIYFSTILLVNVLTVLVIRNRFANKSSSDKSQKLKRNLTLIAIINSSLYFIVFVWQLFGAGVFGIQFFLSSMYILSDSLSLSLPYILLAFDRNVRSTLAGIIGGKAAVIARSLGNNNNMSQRTTSVVSVI